MSIASNEIIQQPQRLALCHAYLNRLYRTAHQTTIKTQSLENTQGDVIFQSMSTVIQHMDLHSHDIYIDLGSGRGKTVFQAFLLSNAKKIIGIEIEPDLHQAALQKYRRMQQELPLFFNKTRRIELIQGDFLKAPFSDVSVAFISAVCFSQTTLIKLASRLNSLPALRSVFSLKPLTHLHCLPFKRTFRIQCSWGTALCYWYE